MRRFNLRVALAFLTLIALLIGSLRWAINSRDAELLAETNALKVFERYCNDVTYGTRPESSFVNAISSFIGEASRKRVIEIDARESDLTDSQLHLLEPMPYIEELDVSLNSISDAGIEIICSAQYAQTLRDLNVGGSQVTGAAISRLNSLNRLQVLVMTGCRVEDDELLQLENKSIRTLGVDATLITDQSLRHIGRHLKVTTLGLSETRCTPRGIVEFIGNYCPPPGSYEIYVGDMPFTPEQLAFVKRDHPNVKIVTD